MYLLYLFLWIIVQTDFADNMSVLIFFSCGRMIVHACRQRRFADIRQLFNLIFLTVIDNPIGNRVLLADWIMSGFFFLSLINYSTFSGKIYLWDAEFLLHEGFIRIGSSTAVRGLEQFKNLVVSYHQISTSCFFDFRCKRRFDDFLTVLRCLYL